MTDETPKPHISRLKDLERAISALEGWAFGPAIHFSATGYGPDFLVSDVRDGKVEALSANLPGLKEFARSLNDAIAPIRAEYAQQLRRAMAEEAIKVGAKALGDMERSQ